MFVRVPTTQSFVENGLSSFCSTQVKQYMQWTNRAYISADLLSLLFEEFVLQAPQKSHKIENWNSKLLGLHYAYLKFARLIKHSNSYILHLSAQLKTICLSKRHKQSIDVFFHTLEKTSLAFCWHSLQTNRFFSKVVQCISIHEWWRLSA